MVTLWHNGRREKASNKYVINFQRSVGNPSVLFFDFVEPKKKKIKRFYVSLYIRNFARFSLASLHP